MFPHICLKGKGGKKVTKQKKKLWSVLLAIVMVFTTVFAGTNTAVIAQAAEKVTIDAEHVEAGKLVVHFKPTTMKTPYVWIYDDKQNYTGGTWPGKPMTEEGDRKSVV